MAGNYKVRLWAIVGESEVGKSPTIRSLISCPTSTSIRPPSTSQVLLRDGGYLDIFAKVQAVQEARWTTADAVREVKTYASKIEGKSPPISAGFINVLFALRFHPIVDLKTTYPGAHDYLSAFVDAGWELQRIVLMAPEESYDDLSRFGASTCWIDDSRNAAEANGRIRNHFGWA